MLRLVDTEYEHVVEIAETRFYCKQLTAGQCVRMSHSLQAFLQDGDDAEYETMISILSEGITKIENTPNSDLDTEQLIRKLYVNDFLELAKEINNKSFLSEDEAKN